MADDTTTNWRHSNAIIGALGALVVLLIFFLLSDLSEAVRHGVGAVLAVAVVLLVVQLGANRRGH
jgi:uncharacterized membrane protein